jgi:hypothetical protein
VHGSGRSVRALRGRASPRAPNAPDAGISDTGGGDTGDPNQPLIDAINAAAEQQRIYDEDLKAHTAALTEAAAQTKRQTDFGEAVLTTENFQLKRILAEAVGAGMGSNVTQRGFTPGYGGVAAY